MNNTPAPLYKCRIYVRVSTKEQADKNKSSLRDQIKLCREIIAKHSDWVEVDSEVFRDIETGQTDDRKGLQKALDEAATGSYNLLVIYDFDRLARNPGVCITLVTRDFLHKGVQVFSSSQPGPLDPPDQINYYSDERILNLIFSAFKSSADINKMRQKYNQGMLNKVNNGELAHPATPPYGYSAEIKGRRQIGKGKGKKIEWEIKIYEPEAKVVRRIFNEYLAGKSYRQIARELTDEAIPTPKKKQWWNYSTVQLILENPAYAKRTRWQWKKTPVPGEGQVRQPKDKWIVRDAKHPWIIEPRRFDSVQRLMKSKAQLPGRASQGKSLLSGIIRCAHCGKRMWGTAETKTAQAYYVCSTWHQFRKCISNFVPMEKTDGMIVDNLLGAIKNEKKFIGEYEKNLKKQEDRPDALQLQQEVMNGLLVQKENLIKAVKAGFLKGDDIRKEMDKIEEELVPTLKIIEELEDKEIQRKSAQEIIQKIKDMRDVKKRLNSNKPKLRTYMLDLLDYVEATKTGRGEHSIRVYFKKF